MHKEHGWNDIDKGKSKYSEKNTHMCHFLGHKSHMDKPEIENWALAVIGLRLTACAMGRTAQLLLFIDSELNLFSVLYLIGLLLRLGVVNNIMLIREICNT